jgi:hypothetical protein
MTKVKKPKLRRVFGISMSPEEQETVQILMSNGGYTNFSQFAKSRIFNRASEAEQRLHEVELGLETVVKVLERQHTRWVEVVNSVNENDVEPLLAASLYLQMLNASGQDRAEVKRWIDMEMVEGTMKEEHHLYRRAN